MTPELNQAFQIGPVALWSIIGGSALVFGLAFAQLYLNWGLAEVARNLGLEVSKSLYRGDLQAVRSACERSVSPVADIFIAALNKVNQPGESTYRAAERERQRLGLSTKRWLWAIGTIGATAPFVGLFGTVIGIIRAFKDIAAAGSVIAVCLYNFLQSRTNHSTVEIRLIVDEFLEQLSSAVENPNLSQRPASEDPPRPSALPQDAVPNVEES